MIDTAQIATSCLARLEAYIEYFADYIAEQIRSTGYVQQVHVADEVMADMLRSYIPYRQQRMVVFVWDDKRFTKKE